MFDLEQQIQEWRQALPSSLGARAEVVEELENHLREEFQRLADSDSLPERAWAAALKRLGTSQQLAGEFDKLPRQPAAWLPARLVFVVLAAIGCWAGWWFGSFALIGTPTGRICSPVLAAHMFAITVGYTGMFALGLLAIWALLLRALWGWDIQHADSYRSYALTLARLGLVMAALGMSLGSLWARNNVGRWWAWDGREVGELAVVLWFGIAMAASSWPSSGGLLLMLVGVIGNIIVSLSWFGPFILFGSNTFLHGDQRHSHGFSSGWQYLVGFCLSQLLILLLAFIPARRVNSQQV